jgi:hypothetical protein
MKHYFVEPEVAGELGDRSILDTSCHPPIVSRLHYRLDGPPADCLIESFPCFAVTEAVMAAILGAGLSGATFEAIELTASEELLELDPAFEVPAVRWLRVSGDSGADFAIGADHRLVLSQRALDLLTPHGLDNAVVEEVGG